MREHIVGEGRLTNRKKREPRKMLRVGGWVVAVLVLYVVVGNVLHRSVFAQPSPDPATYPRGGDEFGSAHEGFHWRVFDVVDDWVVAEVVLEPGAIGPPKHYHNGFFETFVVQEGELHIEVGDQVLALASGESHRVEPLVAHRPFNPGAERVVVRSDEPLVPQSFAACLVQLYPLLDEAEGVSLSLMLQMSVIDPICDTHPADLPRPVLALTNLLLAPAARLMGYRNYDPARALHPKATSGSERGRPDQDGWS